MRRLQPTTQYRKDLKKYKHQPKKLADLARVLSLLKDDTPIPKEYKPHKLQGYYKDCIECHIQSDFLLIWIDETKNIIELVRLDSHAELFGK
ncbi:MAG: type II toxin-antitoxin system YafQ family toxin [Bacteroidales bacterium]|nr:type II toxin-antitoxin system YafQ family toxin [Bacteroidales bacterium]